MHFKPHKENNQGIKPFFYLTSKINLCSILESNKQFHFSVIHLKIL